MKSRKLKITAVAILATLTLATTAFAGIFDVLGGIVLGAGALSNYYTQKGQGAGNNYLDKMAKKINETGDPDAAFNDIVKEYQDGKYDVQVTEADGGKIKTMTASKSDMVVRAIWTLDKNAQTISIKHENVTSGSQVGEILSKKYELKGGATVATESSQQMVSQAAVTPIFSPCNSSLKQISNNKKLGNKHDLFLENNKTGCAMFDNSRLKGNFYIAFCAYVTAKTTNKYHNSYRDMFAKREIEKICEEDKTPFAFPELMKIYDALVAYYKSGAPLNLLAYCIYDYTAPEDANRVFAIKNEGGVKGQGWLYDVYYTNIQKLYISPAQMNKIGEGVMGEGFRYAMDIPLDKAKTVYTKILSITENNKKNIEKLGKMPKGSKVKVTAIRVFFGLSLISRGDDSNASYAPIFDNSVYCIKAIDGYAIRTNQYSTSPNDFSYDFSKSNWYDITSVEQSKNEESLRIGQ